MSESVVEAPWSVVLSGYGRMGAAVEQEVSRSSDFEIVSHSLSSASDCDSVDVVIDFSHASCLEDVINFALSRQSALVVGTTGFADDQMHHLEECASQIPVLYAANFSLGINVIVEQLGLLSNALQPMAREVVISDKHHVHKKDSPSGTALWLSSLLPVKHRIESVREGEEVGEHRITWFCDDEEVVLSHRAFSRNVFAKGALHATRWLLEKRKACVSERFCGMYTMQDVLREAK